MKINRPSQVNFNPYNQQIQKQVDLKKATQKSDELQISQEALKLQENQKPAEKRAAYVDEIKQQVDAGQYKVDYEQTAQKMIEFWKK